MQSRAGGGIESGQAGCAYLVNGARCIDNRYSQRQSKAFIRLFSITFSSDKFRKDQSEGLRPEYWAGG